MAAIQACIKSKYGSLCKAIVLGIAGIEKGHLKSEFKTLVEQQFQLPALILNDAELALYAVLEGENGILAIAGTGSVLIGKKDSTIKMVGGWGHLLGDEGSAYHIGIQALKQLASEIEQGNIQTKLAKALATQYQLPDASAIKEFVYSSTKKEIADIALFVYRRAQDDTDAKKLLEQAGEELAQQAIRLVKQLELETSAIPIIVKGSLLEKNEFVRHHFAEKLKQCSTGISIVCKNRPTVTGALHAWKNSNHD
jgi:N-acetylglucosamine kinase-like BadF-type ATPase